MPDRFHYGRLMHRALRGLMAEVLSEVATDGLPGDHHFFITFDTRHPGVDIADHLRASFPEDMTIVLQHEFWDLTVIGDRFAVTLSFSDVPEKLVIPFEAIRTFVDPSVEFGLRFDSNDEEDEIDDAKGSAGEAEDPAARARAAAATPPAEDADDGPGDTEKPSGDVVSLDRFRKT